MTGQDDLHRLGLKLKFAYSIVGLLLGLACIVAGVILGLGGVAGHTTWTASLFGFSTKINDATPGVIIFVVGIFFVLITRFKVRDRTIIEGPTPNGAHSAESGASTTPAPATLGGGGGGGGGGRIKRDIAYGPLEFPGGS